MLLHADSSEVIRLNDAGRFMVLSLVDGRPFEELLTALSSHLGLPPDGLRKTMKEMLDDLIAEGWLVAS